MHLEWLCAYNIHYADINIDAELAKEEICIDSSGPDQESQCSRVEQKYEYTGMDALLSMT